jgi:hypothetical protein
VLVDRLKEWNQRFHPLPLHILQHDARLLDALVRLGVEDRLSTVFIFVEDVFFLHGLMIANTRSEWKWQSFSVTPRRILAIDVRAASDDLLGETKYPHEKQHVD